MAGTLADLKARIIAETNRDDLADDLAGVLASTISAAIRFYAARPFFFNDLRDTSASTIAGNEYVARPTGLRALRVLKIVVGGIERDLRKINGDELERLAAVPTSGQPYKFAEVDTRLRLYPKPNAVFALVTLGVFDLAALANDAASNGWTDADIGQDLIANETKFRLARDTFRNDKMAAAAAVARDDALQLLRAETRRRAGTGRLRPCS